MVLVLGTVAVRFLGGWARRVGRPEGLGPYRGRQRLQSAAEREARPQARTPSRDRVSRSSPRTRTNQRSSQSSAQWQPDSGAAGRGVSGGPRDSGPTRGGSGHKVPLSVRPGRRHAPPVGTVSHGPPPEREQTSGRPSPRHSGSLIPGRLGEACRAARETRALPGAAAATKCR